VTPLASVVIPAHDEQSVIGRLLERLLARTALGELDVVVVPNGCTDRTAEVAASYGPDVRVVESPIPSKRAALRLGDEHARTFPRLYVDADVELGADDVRQLRAALAEPGVLAVAPERQLDLAGRSRGVRMYHQVWTRLPAVRTRLFGRGVLAVTEEGYKRIRALPPVMADDLAASLAFAPDECAIVAGAAVVVRPPRTWPDLVRRRIRVETGTSQLEQEDVVPGASARTGVRDLVGMVRGEPGLAPAMFVFLATAVVARLGARRAKRAGDFSTWLRDESSRRD
jgi:glycosyltransferase involved in cell wall biosynthesis